MQALPYRGVIGIHQRIKIQAERERECVCVCGQKEGKRAIDKERAREIETL